MNTTTDPSSIPTLVDAAELNQLAPALDGYPVDSLLAVFEDAEPGERRRARQLVEACIGNWIAALDATLETYMSIPAASLAAVRAKQLEARDALCRLLVTVSCVGVGPGVRGRPC